MEKCNLIVDDNGQFWVTSKYGTVQGYPALNKNEKSCTLYDFVIDKDHRHQGHGTNLLKHTIKAAKKLGFKFLDLCTETDLIPWYEKFGFYRINKNWNELRKDL